MDGSVSSGNSLTIVAVPSDSDPVRRFSSEKEPHLTLLYLGDNKFNADQLAMITEYIGHAASMLSTFLLTVDSRGELGSDKADVLFFDKNWSRDIATFRSHLLKNDLISEAYHSVEQYPEWIPHLTMGYPSSPAKKDDREYPGFSFVNFDKIAFWTGDYEGPTFQLKPRDYNAELTMSQIEAGRSAAENVLQHYGVKGMHWGVRKSEPGGSISSRMIRRADSKFEKKAQSAKTTLAIYNAAASHVNKYDIDRINNKPKYKNADLTEPSKLQREYYKEHQDAMVQALKNAARDMGTNASGTRQYSVSVNEDGSWDVNVTDVKHDAMTAFKIVPEYDDLGHITSLSVVNPELKHYGVKGMRWGVRRSQNELDSAAGRSISEDAKAVVVSQRKIDFGGTQTLSNRELQQLVDRMNLENRYHSMVTDKSKFDQTVKTAQKVLAVGDSIEKARKFAKSPSGKAIKRGAKIAFNAAKVGAAFYTGGTSGAASTAGTLVVQRAANHFTNVGI